MPDGEPNSRAPIPEEGWLAFWLIGSILAMCYGAITGTTWALVIGTISAIASGLAIFNHAFLDPQS